VPPTRRAGDSGRYLLWAGPHASLIRGGQ
jgi:hypothetical protein